MIRVAVFDLDNTLYDATTVPDDVLAPAVAAVRRANTGPDAIPDVVLEAALHSARRLGFLQLAERHSLPSSLRAAWRDAYRGLVVRTPLSPYPDVLPALQALDLIKVLLTTGFRGMQESKIAALDIAHLFHAIYIDALDQGGGPGKQRLLRDILEAYACRPPEVLVIGDSPENEIAAGNAVGAITVQILRPGIVFSDAALYHLTSLAELPRLLATL
ncbi:MAG: HAD family hydrolase [Gemmatimonadetes bacterium]|nr:HAD family hydrolase [Gemmatimonadota bacterium]MBI2614989.1 HAD family hydrolase [Gemmatimonadota bacterium]